MDDVGGMASEPTFRRTAPAHGWLGDATLASLERLEAVIAGGRDEELVARSRTQLNALRGSIHLLLEAAGEGWSARQASNATGSFGQVACATMEQLGVEAQARGIVLDHELSPSLHAVQFAPGGGVLVGLVRQTMATLRDGGGGRHLTVTATVDGRCRVVIGIQDSAQMSHDQFSITDLSQWRRRIAVLGGELRLRSVPFGSGMTIEACVPARRLAA